MHRVGISGTGSCLPRRVVDNEELYQECDEETKSRIQEIGSQSRRWASSDEELPVIMAVAAKRALEDACLEISDVDAIIVGSNFTDRYPIPNLAPRLHHLLGLSRKNAYDIGIACCASVQGMMNGRDYLIARRSEDKVPKQRHVLMVSGDLMSRVTKRSSPVNRAILADGAGAVVLSDLETDADLGILSAAMYVEGNPHLISYDVCPGEDPVTFDMNGGEVYKFVKRTLGALTKEAFEKATIPLSQLARTKIVPHQVNAYAIEQFPNFLFRSLGIEIPRENFYSRGAAMYGNTSAAGCLIGIDELNHGGNLIRGDLVYLPVWAAGTTNGYVLLGWSRDKPAFGLFDDRVLQERTLAHYAALYQPFLEAVKEIKDRRVAKHNP